MSLGLRHALTGGLVLLIFAAGSLIHAQKIRSSIPIDRVPGWVQEAANRPVPESDRDICWLHQEVIVEPLPEGGVRETYRIVGKLLKRAAADHVARFSIVYGKEDEVLAFASWTLMPDGTARKASDDTRRGKGDIIDRPYSDAVTVYEDRRRRRVIAPGAVEGAVVAHESVILRNLDLGAERLLFGAPDHPTLFSRLTLRLPEGWSWEAARYRDEAITMEQSENSISFVARNLEPLPWEEWRPPLAEVLPAVWVRWWSPDGSRGFKDWDEVGRWFNELAEPVLEERGDAGAIAAGIKPAGQDGLLEATGKAFAYVARQIRYVSIQIGIGGYKPYTPAEVIRNSYGDCKDKTWLLRALISDWKLETYPVLVRTYGEGDLLTEVPTPKMFDHVIVAVKLPPGTAEHLWAAKEVEGLGRLLFMDGTISQADAWTLPPSDQGTTALVVHSGGGTLVDLPIQPAEASVTSTMIEAGVDGQGRLVQAEIERQCTGMDAVWMRHEQQGLSSEERRKEREWEVQEWFPGSSLNGYRATGLDDPDGHVEERFTLANGRAGKRIQDLLLIEPGNLTRTFLGQVLPPPPMRWELWLEYPRTRKAEVRLKVPPGWEPEELPGIYEARSEDLAVTAEWSFEDSTLLYRWKAILLTNEVPPERYEAFRDLVMQQTMKSAQPVVFLHAQPAAQ